MWKSIFIVIAVFAAFDSAACASEEVDKVRAWAIQAQDSGNSLQARIREINEIGLFKTKDPETLLLVNDVFKDLLNNPQVRSFETNYFRLFVIRAIGDFGPDAHALSSYIAQYAGTEKVLNDAIDVTLAKIRKPVVAQPPTSAGKLAPDANIKKWLATLKNPNAKQQDRVNASNSLQTSLKAGKKESVVPILDGLLQAVNDRHVSTRILAAKTTRKEGIKAAKESLKDDAKRWSTWKDEFVANLLVMVDKNESPTVGERLEGVQALGEFGSDATAGLEVLRKIADSDSDGDVRLAATAAISNITGKK